MLLYNKKAALTTKQTVLLILVIISLVVVLYFIFRMNIGGETKKEVCRNSVLLKGESVFPGQVSLDCRPYYVCLSKTNSCGNEIVDEVVKVSNKDDVYKAIADEMVDCWWVFGEGGIEYVDRAVLKTGYYCSICNTIVFDESVKEIFEYRRGFLYEKENIKGRIFTIEQKAIDKNLEFSYYFPDLVFRFKDNIWQWSWKERTDSSYDFYWRDTSDFRTNSSWNFPAVEVDSPNIWLNDEKYFFRRKVTDFVEELDKVSRNESEGLELILGDGCYAKDAICFPQEELHEYMINHDVPGKKLQYDEYLYGVDFTDVDQLLEVASDQTFKTDIFPNVNLDRKHIILMAIKDEISAWTWPIIAAGSAVIAATVIVFTGGAALPAVLVTALKALHVGTIIVIGAGIGAGTYTAFVSEGPSGNTYIRPFLTELNPRSFDKQGCYDIITFP